MKYKGTQLESLRAIEKMPGFKGKFVHTDDLTIAYWEIEKGSELPEHAHVNKQIVQMMSGEFAMTIGGEDHTYRAGDIVEIPGNVPHSGRAITDCTIHDIFLPARDDMKY